MPWLKVEVAATAYRGGAEDWSAVTRDRLLPRASIVPAMEVGTACRVTAEAQLQISAGVVDPLGPLNERTDRRSRRRLALSKVGVGCDIGTDHGLRQRPAGQKSIDQFRIGVRLFVVRLVSCSRQHDDARLLE